MSKKESWDASTVHQIRAAAGIPEGSNSVIKELDFQSLERRKQVLVVEQFTGSGECLSIHVLRHATRSFQQIWKLDQDPQSKGGICKFMARSPRVAVGTGGEIVLHTPSVYIDLPNRVEEYVYLWNGSTYTLKHHRTLSR